MSSAEVQELMRKYKDKIDSQFGTDEKEPLPVESREYQEFKKATLPKAMTIYESLCNQAEHLLKIKPDPKREQELQEAINICHLNVTPSGTASFAIVYPLLLMVVGGAFSYLATGSMFFVAFFLISGSLLMVFLGKIPQYLATSWRMRASNQMIICIFYVVTYMRHTSNLEKAIAFAADHLAPPLSLDLKKVLWDVETGKRESVKESLETYLESWRKWNLEFIEAFHLIESSLYEGLEERRLALLDKSLDVILEETYERMMHYAQNLKSPITMLHMMGIILPILGLVILPLVVSFMENVKWYHIATLYNIVLPISVYYLGKTILSTRPTGYGDTDIAEENPELKKYRNIVVNFFGAEIQINPLPVSVFIGAVLFFIGISPLVIHFLSPSFDMQIVEGVELIGYRESVTTPGLILGPYGMGAAVLSLFVPLSFGIGVGLYYRLRSQNVIKIREQAKQLEDEFASALFQLGNRLGDNIPAEIAFGRVSDVMEGTISGNFFRTINTNIKKLGMSVPDAIFDSKVGALVYFPSNVIASSMKVLIQSIKKGPVIAAQALLNISRYIKEIHRVNERLKDLMADIISSMKSQISFLTPVISGIVIGITSMITNIIGKLGSQMKTLGGEAGGTASSMADFFGDGLPTYYFQIVVGVYVVQIIFILTILANGIENGEDKLQERYMLGVNLIRSTIIYCFVAMFVMVVFNIIAMNIMGVNVPTQ
ncbi:MAG: hypothetical protein V1837_02450 [Candidatus Woesearchaeota archaeon]